MRISALSFIIFTGLFGCIQPEYDPAATIERNLGVLASDSLQGREVGTEGERMAAAYIVEAFKERDILAKGTDQFYQSFFVNDSSNPHAQPGDSLEENGITGYNVIGMIDNPGDEVVVVGAHYDHLGMGGFSSLHRGEQSVHNGADDNASGVAAMLHLAKVLKEQTLNRDIVFIGFSGEEKGLWGSNYFTKNPTIDLKKVNFMINMDMIGRLDSTKGLAVNGVGTSPRWSEILDTSNADSLKLIKSQSGVGPSDHTSFYFQDIPVLHFFTGQHDDYHKPSDDIEKVNIDGVIQVADIIERIIIQTDSIAKMKFTKTKDESRKAPRFTVTLGVVPDYLFDGEGMRIDGVSAEKPAEKAGIQKGDIVVQLGDSTIRDMMSYMRTLATFKKGDQTKVKVQREGEELVLDVSF